MSNAESKAIWITGCAGFLGKRLAGHLAALGHSVVGLSRRRCLISGRSVPIDLAANDAGEQLQDLIMEIGRPDVIVHAASKQPGPGTLSDFVRSNVQTTANLLEAFSQCPPPLIIYTSTQSVYNGTASLPMKETSPATGTLPYSATKRWGEQLLETFSVGSSITVLRLPSLYGKGQADSFVDGLARLALRGDQIELFSRGELIRDALHVNDVVSAITSCLKQPLDGSFRVMNLGCGRPIRTYEYGQALVHALESHSEILRVDRPASQPDLYGDIDQARQRIGFEPTPLEQSMRIYADELRA